MTNDEILNRFFQLEIHSLKTWDNTDLMRQAGKAVYYGDIFLTLGDNQVMNDMDGIVTAFELKTPTDDDRVSVRFMPSDTVFNYKATFLCIPRSAWLKILSSNLRRTNYKPQFN